MLENPTYPHSRNGVPRPFVYNVSSFRVTITTPYAFRICTSIPEDSRYTITCTAFLSLSFSKCNRTSNFPSSLPRPRFPARPYIIPTAKICIPTIRICQDIATDRTEWSLAGSRSDNESSPPFHLSSSLHRGVSRRHVALFLLFFLFVRSSYRASSPSDPLSLIRSANHSYQLPVFPNR